jgi:hypothetical protein
MEPVAQIKCVSCKTTAVLSVRKAKPGEPSFPLQATSITMPCGHHGSDDKRWTGQIVEMKLEMLSK